MMRIRTESKSTTHAGKLSICGANNKCCVANGSATPFVNLVVPASAVFGRGRQPDWLALIFVEVLSRYERSSSTIGGLP
jgi:hypothetical protein